MKKLSAKVNVVAPGGANDYGQLKDDPGNNTGTPVDVDLLADLSVFFERLMEKAGITPNGFRDDNVNGYQLFEAFQQFAPMRKNFVNLPAWNMDSDVFTIFPHGVSDYTKIRSIDVIIFADDGTTRVPLFPHGSWTLEYTPGNAAVSRINGGYFDQSAFSALATSRGIAVISYVE